MEQTRKQLLASFDDKGTDAWIEPLVQLTHRHNARDESQKLEEFLESLSEKDQAKLWDALAARLAPYISAVTIENEEAEEGGEEKKGEGKDACVAFRLLQAVVTMAQTTLTVSKKGAKLANGLLQCMMSLHDVLFQLGGVDGEALQAQIAKVCEQWWKEERGGAEFLIPQLMPYMVARSLEDDAKEALVKRVYALRGALLLLDYDDEATDAFKTLLLQCFLKTTYLRSADGRRLLTYVFGLHPDIIPDIHATVKNQLPRASKKVVQAYGDVYFRAWKAATGPYLERIETECVQDVMYCAVSCSCPALYVNLRLLLHAFHSNKRLREVDAMLLRLYNPIIWRSLQVANPVVRAQATGLLVDAFPLQNPDAGTVEVNALLQKQLDMLQTLLLDADPRVRVSAVAGVCRIMAVYWEAIPLHVTQAYITRLVGSLAMDGSSALVRQSVVEGLALLLDQPLSHPVLRAALPLAAPLLHDKADRVRAAFLTLLNKVKGVRDIKFYHIVQVDQLLNRFAEDAKCGKVSSKMALLLLNSYFPQGPEVTGAKQVARCLTFLRQSKGAALAFYSRLRDHVSLSTVVKLAAMLLRCVFTAALKDKAAQPQKKGGKADRKRPRDKLTKKGKGKGKQQDENAEPAPEESPSEDEEEDDEAVEPGTLEGILEVVRVLWSSVADELQESANKPIANALIETLQGQDVLGLYERLDDVKPLLGLACLGHAAFGALLTPMGNDLRDDKNDRAGPITATLCAWDKTSEVVELICASLEVVGTSAAASKGAKASSRTKAEPAGKDGGKRKRGAASLESLTGGLVPPATALAMLDYLLQGEGDEGTRVREDLVASEALVARLRGALGKAREALDKRVSANGSAKSIEPQGSEVRHVLVGCIEALFRLEFHVWAHHHALATQDAGPPPEGSMLSPSPEMTACLHWLDRTIIPAALMQPQQDGNQPGHAMSPLSPPPRKPKVSASSQQVQDEAAKAGLAQEVLCVCLTMCGDWVVCGVGLQALSEATQSWAERFFLPALRTHEESAARDMVLATMPQLCKLCYQLALHEAQGSRLLPAALLEIVIQSAAHHLAPEPQHRYNDSSVDSEACLSALLHLYYKGSTRSGNMGAAATAALNGLLERMLGPVTTVEAQGQEADEESVALSAALCSVLAKSAPGLNTVGGEVMAELKELSKPRPADDGGNSNAAEEEASAQRHVVERLGLLAKLLETAASDAGAKAPPRATVTLTTKVLRGIKEAQDVVRRRKRMAQRHEGDMDEEDEDGEGEEGDWMVALEGVSGRLKALHLTAGAGTQAVAAMDEDEDGPN